MPSSKQTDFEKECALIIRERLTYQENRPGESVAVKFYDWLSFGLLLVGILGLLLMPFTDITLLQVTCIFIISRALAPSDLDYTRPMLKGIAEDLGHVRASVTVIRNLKSKDRK